MPDGAGRADRAPGRARVTLGGLVTDQVVAVRAQLAALHAGADAAQDAREALQRLRASLTVLTPVLGEPPGDLLTELRWLARELDGARDLEVVAARLDDPLRTAADRQAADVLGEALRSHSARTAASVRTTASDPRLQDLVAGLDGLQSTEIGEIYHDVYAHVVVRNALANLIRTLPVAVAALRSPDASRSQRARLLHEQRGQVRGITAVLPLIEPTTGTRPRLAKVLRQLRDLLGEHHGALVVRHWLAGVATEHPQAAELVRDLRRRERAAMATAEDRFPETVDRLVARGGLLLRTPGVHLAPS